MVKDIYSISYKMKKELYEKIISIVLAFVVSVFLVSIITTFFIFPVFSKSDSMENDIPEKSFVLVSPLLKNAERGEVMLCDAGEKYKYSFFSSAVNFVCRFFSAQQFSPLGNSKSISPCLRRVVGLPGDTIYISNYIVFIKPEGEAQYLTEFELTKIKYNLTVSENGAGIDMKIGALGNMDKITLKKNEYFVLADNRAEGVDSRIWGTLSSDDFKGKALFIYLPVNNARFF